MLPKPSVASRHPTAVLLALIVGGVTGCASSGAARTTPDPVNTTAERVEISGASVTGTRMGNGSSLSLQTSRTDYGESATFAVPTDSLWSALAQAYAAVGIEPNTAVSAQGRIGLLNARVRRQLGKTALSQYLSCGQDAMGVPHADAFDVVLNVASQIAPNGPTASTLTTRVAAQAHSPAASGVDVTCGSTGVLESRIANAVRLQLGR